MRNNETFCRGPATFCLGVDVEGDRVVPDYAAIIEMSTHMFYTRLG